MVLASSIEKRKKQITYFQGKFDAMHQKLKTRI